MDAQAAIEELRGSVVAVTAIVMALCETHPRPGLLHQRFTRFSEGAIAELLATSQSEAFLQGMHSALAKMDSYLLALADPPNGRNSAE